MGHTALIPVLFTTLALLASVAAQDIAQYPIALENIPPSLTPDPAIIKGQRAQPGEFPYQAFLYSTRFFGLIGSTCGGSLIQPTWVLTAAHCINGQQTTEVFLGGTNINNMTYRARPTFRKMHERYNPSTFENDVALLRLPRPAMGDNIGIIALAPADIGTLDREPVVVSGYGKTSNNGEGSPDLMRVDLTTIPNSECMTHFSTIKESTLCAWYSTEQGQSACQGDSGGPMTYNSTNGPVLVGAVSFGAADGCDTKPVAYARISSFVTWIETTMSQNQG